MKKSLFKSPFLRKIARKRREMLPEPDSAEDLARAMFAVAEKGLRKTRVIKGRSPGKESGTDQSKSAVDG